MMKKTFRLVILMMAATQALQAQSGKQATSEQIVRQQNDSVILASMIMPVVNGAAVPDWDKLAADVKAKYGEVFVDRSVTKAKIYYYYGKEWPLFSKSLVHYTEAYEDKENLKLMNKNAKMVLQYSQNPDELKAALGWMKHAITKEPGDAGYKDTYDALTMKVKGKMVNGGL